MTRPDASHLLSREPRVSMRSEIHVDRSRVMVLGGKNRAVLARYHTLSFKITYNLSLASARLRAILVRTSFEEKPVT